MTILLNPKKLTRTYNDARSREIMEKTVAFFEAKGKTRLKDDDRNQVFYEDFLAFVKQERIFATMCTPAGYGAADARWDTWRVCEFAEILGFYGLAYWYTYQVSVLGLGPIWMTKNEPLKQRAATLLEEGAIFAFGLSERAHGADVYSTDMKLTPAAGGGYEANGEKYYIGNANKARMVSTFGQFVDSKEYGFFVADSQHEKYHCVRNVVNSQSYVANYALKAYPVPESEILARGQEAWDSALNTVNIGKYNLGWASIGICTHALYEAIHHAANRTLYNMKVTDFPHVQRLFADAYARLVAMKLVALRAADYMRSASLQDRRYLLYNPVVKMKVTTQGEDVVNHLWDVIAAKGFERDMYFEMAARDIRALPKLEGTVHVNIALIIKFMTNYFLNHEAFAPVGRRDEAADDTFLFSQGPTGGLGKIRFHNYQAVFDACSLPNVEIFKRQLQIFKECMFSAPPSQAQTKDTDFLMALGELFVLIVYAQLVLENAAIYKIEGALLDQIFDVFVRDFSRHATDLHGKPSTTDAQAGYCLRMVHRPHDDRARFASVWSDVFSLRDAYSMAP